MEQWQWWSKQLFDISWYITANPVMMLFHCNWFILSHIEWSNFLISAEWHLCFCFSLSVDSGSVKGHSYHQCLLTHIHPHTRTHTHKCTSSRKYIGLTPEWERSEKCNLFGFQSIKLHSGHNLLYWKMYVVVLTDVLFEWNALLVTFTFTAKSLLMPQNARKMNHFNNCSVLNSKVVLGVAT